MRKVLIAAAAAAGIAISGCATPPDTTTGSEVAKIMLEKGHGSGVHIGNGYILTAAHVVGDAKSVKLKSSIGDIQEGTVLWVNSTYDIALVQAERPARFKSARLSCRTAKTGEAIESRGNPTQLEFVSAWGRISGDTRELGPWKSVLITDSTTVMGMSGGGVFDGNGDVIGITVGVMSVGNMFGQSLTGFGTVVPSSVACKLLGRGVGV